MNNLPFPDPLRQAFRADAPLISPALTQSPAQDLDRSQSWPILLGEGQQVRHPKSQDPRGPAGRRYPLESAGVGSPGSRENSALRFNSGSFLQNAQNDVEMLDGVEAPGSEHQEKERIPSFPPRPRPQAHLRRKSTFNDPSSAALPREPVQTEPYRLEPPQDAPKLFAGQTADFAPWSSHEPHAEDALNEQTIISGYYDKTHITPHEMSTARPLISSSIKHKSGLQILSSLFTCTLKQRQLCGMISSKCTFKPPPRVTLTDTRREAWLKDLADSSIPLRRLSRTIPQGIRGKALLDHCMAKEVPTWRAVWLIKCVGANEIRACKRNRATGAIVAGGESKWIKDWTVQLQQFVEALVNGCGAYEWKRKFTLGLQLLMHIYREHLLDRDAFLEWLCGSLESATIDTVPIWLLVVKLYLAELVAYRKHGRQLAVSLLQQQRSIVTQGPFKSLSYLRDQLTAHILNLMLAQPACFLSADFWSSFEDCMSHSAAQFSLVGQQVYRNMLERNSNIWNNCFGETSTSCLVTNLIQLLDKVPSNFDFRSFSDRCLSTSKQSRAVILTTLHWATTKYRFGLQRLYLAVRLVRHWSRQSIDLHPPVFAFLETASESSVLVRRNVYKLIAELTRSRHFSVSKYLQWLMARGVQKAAASETSDFYSEILDNIPCHDLPDHVHNLRVHILGASDRPVDILAHAKSSIGSRLTFMGNSGAVQDPPISPPLPDLKGLWMNDFYELSSWMRQALRDHALGSNDGDEIMHGNNVGQQLLIEDFLVYSKVLTYFQDFAFWADILKMFIDRGQQAVMVGVADSLNSDLEIFYAIGAASDLFSRLFKRSTTLDLGLSERPLITSLIDLASILPGTNHARSALQRELQRAENGSILAAGSPVIDWVSDPTLNPDSNFLSLVDEVLRSGSSMDRQILDRVFFDVTARIEMLWTGKYKILPSFYELLPRLRFFDGESFDKLMVAWLDRVLMAPRRPPLVAVVSPLVCNATTSFEQFLVCALAHIKDSQSVDDTELIDLTRQHQGPYIRSYRYHFQRRTIVSSRPDLVYPLLSAVLEMRHEQASFEAQIRKIVSQRAFPELLQTLLLSPSIDAQQSRSALAGPQASDFTAQMLNRVLFRSSVPESDDAIVATVRTANEFNATLCQVKLSTLLGAHVARSVARSESDDLANILFQEALLQDGASLGVWQEMLQALTTEVLQKFQAIAIGRLFALMPTFALPSDGVLPGYPATAYLDRLLGLTGLAVEQVPVPSRFPIVIQAADKLQAMLLWLAKPAPLSSEAHSDTEPWKSAGSDISAGARPWLLILLRLLTIHRSVFAHPKLAQSTVARLAYHLALLLIQPAVNADHALATRLFDLLALLSDVLTPETRHSCFRALCEQQRLRDPRLRFLFGTAGTASGSPLLFVEADKTSALGKVLAAPTSNGVAGSTVAEGQAPLGKPYEPNRWELLSNANPVMGENDTCISLSVFGAKKAVL